ncbi:NAD(P)H-dependent oxidoreductase subunit E [Telmatocola sphagniphila]|uniref:NAD(P)H-dependent oxidoreductase subunit E n=1 Tax=Telmatocola sphagniphila TaxID=1123043 RepID=A0A8E6BD09_9BACT|nr:NAD(P)H-dependent oxidoreductase subunit E [Telmatocola sphagniphila]QVL34655.1 NAD(P)H-dependent oxidoreductase subunit E [Telmatocola sphagniphila]
MSEVKQELAKIAKTLCIGSYSRHVLLCAGEKCCSAEVGQEAWEVLKRELKDRQLSLSTAENACFRTKAGCLRVCSNGPILVVYPEGDWYHDMTADKIPEFVERHLVQNQPIEDWIFAKNPLGEEQES